MALRILIVGALPPPVGGTSVSLQELVRALRERGTTVHVVDCSVRSAPLGQLRTLLRALMQAARLIRHSDVVTCHMSDRGATVAAPLFRLLAFIAGKPFLYRQFGGEFHHTYARGGALRRWLLRRSVLHADLVLLQTRELIGYFAALCKHPAQWFPTARSDLGIRYQASFARGERKTLRCIFIGHLRRTKGICEAVAAIHHVPGCELHIFGPLVDVREEELRALRCTYHGVLAPERVQHELAAADVLLFPTYHSGEGYPGTLVEAAIVGLPVVASRWQALPEMFPDGELLMVEPRSVSDIVVQLRQILAGATDLQLRSQSMRRRSGDFDLVHVSARFEQLCADLIPVRASSRS